jgi:hypothetical protein
MKSSLKLLALVLWFAAFVALAPTVNAQTQPVYSPITLLSATITNSAIISPTNIVLDIRKQQDVAVQMLVTASGTCNSNVICTFKRSVDGVTYDGGGTPVTITLNDTTPVPVLTNLLGYGAGYIKLTSINNASDVTNITFVLKYGLKIGAE